jgi:hypothetical protein
MMRGESNSSTNGAGFDYGLQEFQNAIETLLNVFYLLELEANNPAHVRKYLRLTDPAMESLLKILKARLESGERREGTKMTA